MSTTLERRTRSRISSFPSVSCVFASKCAVTACISSSESRSSTRRASRRRSFVKSKSVRPWTRMCWSTSTKTSVSSMISSPMISSTMSSKVTMPMISPVLASSTTRGGEAARRDGRCCSGGVFFGRSTFSKRRIDRFEEVCFSSASAIRVLPRGDRCAARTSARWPWPRLNNLSTSSSVLVSSTVTMDRSKIDSSDESGVSSSGSTKMRSFTKSRPTIDSRSPRKTGTREKPCSKMARTVWNERFVDSGSMYTSSNGVITSTTDFCVISSAPRITWPDSSSSSPRCTWTFMYWSISVLVCTVPTSSPSSRSSMRPSGTAIGARITRKKRTIGSAEAPTLRACRLHVACGRISPKTTISVVDAIRPHTDE
mmetsp:Transcript_13284/g.42009  ORF Transcript_13284/g.42009 Transcript_13284/m.42009 type:complete len:369 (+) Transcript_13284:45-1151(+)